MRSEAQNDNPRCARLVYLDYSLRIRRREDMRTAQLLSLIFMVLLSAAAFSADLSGYNGAYPFDEVGGYSFFDNPAVKAAIDGVAGDSVSEWLAELQVGLPIEQQADG